MDRMMVALLILLALTEGCASTLQAKPEHPSGFFQDTARLGVTADAVVPHVHAQDKVEWAAYDKIQLAPVTLWDDFSSQLSAKEQEDLTQLSKSFYEMLYHKFSKDYVLVANPSPGSMRIQVVITHAERSWVAPSFLSKVSWQLQALNSVLTYLRGKPAFAGEITIEFTVHDSMTDALLFAGTDRRVGGQKLFDKEVFNSWGDVQNSLQFWTDQTAYHLCLAREGPNCRQPKA